MMKGGNDDDTPYARADDLPTFSCLPIVNLIWLAMLSIAVLLLWSTSIENGTFTPPAMSPILHAKEQGPAPQLLQANSYSYPFTIALPKSRSTSFMFRLPASGYLPITDLNTIDHYRVCCRTVDRTYFVCHSITKNIGIDCVLQQERVSRKVFATVVVQHRDMIGSTCRLHWTLNEK